MPGRTIGEEHVAVAAGRLGDDSIATLIAGSDGDIMLVRPDGHLAWRARADAEALDRWLSATAYVQPCRRK
jgi:hypothetical protein